MQEFWVEEESYEEERKKIARKNAEEATKIKVAERRPWTIEEQGFGIGQK